MVAEFENQRTGIKESWSDVAVAAGGLCAIRSSSSAVILRMESGQPEAIYHEQFGKFVAPQPSSIPQILSFRTAPSVWCWTTKAALNPVLIMRKIAWIMFSRTNAPKFRTSKGRKT